MKTFYQLLMDLDNKQLNSKVSNYKTRGARRVQARLDSKSETIHLNRGITKMVSRYLNSFEENTSYFGHFPGE